MSCIYKKTKTIILYHYRKTIILWIWSVILIEYILLLLSYLSYLYQIEVNRVSWKYDSICYNFYLNSFFLIRTITRQKMGLNVRPKIWNFRLYFNNINNSKCYIIYLKMYKYNVKCNSIHIISKVQLSKIFIFLRLYLKNMITSLSSL